MKLPLDAYAVTAQTSIREVMQCIDRNRSGIALVLDGEGRLVSTITDGDIRRAILAGVNLEANAAFLLASKPPRPASTAPAGTSRVQLIELMQKHAIRQLPLTDANGKVESLALLSEMVDEEPLPLKAVVMAGGIGSRLHPLTEQMPKPMLPVGDRPLLERIVSQLRDAGITRLSVSTNYKGEVIADHFGSGEEFGISIDYLREQERMGTAGALSLLEPPKEPLLVMNGDVLTGLNFRAMLEFHKEHHADMTVAVREYQISVPYGVVEADGVIVSRIVEKPMVRHFINAGIYLLDPRVHSMIPAGKKYDMTELIEQLIKQKHKVVSFPIREYWLDIGQLEDYKQAQKDVELGRV